MVPAKVRGRRSDEAMSTEKDVLNADSDGTKNADDSANDIYMDAFEAHVDNDAAVQAQLMVMAAVSLRKVIQR